MKMNAKKITRRLKKNKKLSRKKRLMKMARLKSQRQKAKRRKKETPPRPRTIPPRRKMQLQNLKPRKSPKKNTREAFSKKLVSLTMITLTFRSKRRKQLPSPPKRKRKPAPISSQPIQKTQSQYLLTML